MTDIPLNNIYVNSFSIYSKDCTFIEDNKIVLTSEEAKISDLYYDISMPAPIPIDREYKSGRVLLKSTYGYGVYSFEVDFKPSSSVMAFIALRDTKTTKQIVLFGSGLMPILGTAKYRSGFAEYDRFSCNSKWLPKVRSLRVKVYYSINNITIQYNDKVVYNTKIQDLNPDLEFFAALDVVKPYFPMRKPTLTIKNLTYESY